MKVKAFHLWLLTALFIILTVVTYLIIKNKQEITLAQQIDNPATLILTDAPSLPSNLDQEFSRNLDSGQEFDLFIYLYPQENPLIAVDLEIDFDPNVVQVLEKTDGGLFPTYVEPVDGGYLNQTQGKINFSGVAFNLESEQPAAPTTSQGEFARFRVKVKESLSPQVSQIAFNPTVVDPQNNLTTDSNLVDSEGEEGNPRDVLGKVGNFKLVINQPGDVDGSGQVDILDFYLISINYGQQENFELRADINRDGQVDILDFYQISRNWQRSY